MAVFGLGLLYELPEIVARFGSNSSMLDAAAKLFNNRLLPLVYDLNSQLSGAKFTYINCYGISKTINTGVCFRALVGYCEAATKLYQKKTFNR